MNEIYTTVGAFNDAALDYNITVEFIGDDWSEDLKDGAKAAVDTVADIITEDLPDRFIASIGNIDDLYIEATMLEIDGEFNVLGSAGPRFFRDDDGKITSYTGVMEFDTADADRLNEPFDEDTGESDWINVVTHEVMHILGFGTLWERAGLFDDSTDPPRFTGENASHEYQFEFPDIFANDPDGALGVPIENETGLEGTDGGHWTESIFDTELMTGFLDGDGVEFFSNMTLASLQDLGYETTYVATPCFLSGTQITTPEGPRAVEALRPGDLVATAEGPAAVLWVGQRFVATDRLGIDPWEDVIEIAPGALGAGQPQRTLRLTADHALALTGVLVVAGALVGQPGVRRLSHRTAGQRAAQGYTVYHIETEAHALLWAEGAAAESFVPYKGRDAFDNAAEYRALYKTDREIAELPLPRISSRMHARTLLPKTRFAA